MKECIKERKKEIRKSVLKKERNKNERVYQKKERIKGHVE